MRMSKKEVDPYIAFIRETYLTAEERRQFPDVKPLIYYFKTRNGKTWAEKPENQGVVILSEYPMRCCSRFLMTVAGRCANPKCMHSIWHDVPILEAAE